MITKVPATYPIPNHETGHMYHMRYFVDPKTRKVYRLHKFRATKPDGSNRCFPSEKKAQGWLDA